MKKKAFTLIELLAVILILAIISIIATPKILDVVNDARISADRSTAYNIIDAARLYKAESVFDIEKQLKIKNMDNIYDEIIVSGKIPLTGDLRVKENGAIAMSVVIHDKCYKKEFAGNLAVSENEECNIRYIGNDNVAPTIALRIPSNILNENGWAKNDFFVEVEVIDDDNEGASGGYSYARCIDDTVCEPGVLTESSTGTIAITNEKATNVLCVIGYDMAGNSSEKVCNTFKLDKSTPEFTGISDLIVNINTPVNLTDGVSVEDSISSLNGTYTLDPATVDTSVAGTTDIIYTATDLAGNTKNITRKIIVDAEAPQITFTDVDNAINSNGWAKEDFYVKVELMDNSNTGINIAKWCTTQEDTCVPNATMSTNIMTPLINQEGNNRICIYVKDNNNKETTLCSNSYKLDKIAPTIAGTNDKTIEKNTPIDLTYGVVVNDLLSTIDGTFTIIPATIDTSIAGINTINYSVSDKAGNTTIITRTITVKTTPPTVEFTTPGGIINSNGWAKENFYVTATATPDETTTISNILWCSDITDCNPTASVNSNKSSAYISAESDSNVMCVRAIDATGVSSEIICSDHYKLDKTVPQITGISDITVEKNTLINLRAGVSAYDDLSAIDGDYSLDTENVDTTTAGLKRVVYNVSDKAGNIYTVTKNITVRTTPPTIEFNAPSGTINENGWAKNDFSVTIVATPDATTTISNILWCNDTSECTPTINASSGTISVPINNESTNNIVCAKATDGTGVESEVICSQYYKLDKTAPSFTGISDINVQTNGLVDLNDGVSVFDTLSNLNGTYTYSPITVDTSMVGITNITYTASDMAGNIREITRKVIVDAMAPTISYEVQGTPFNENGWAKEDFYVKVDVTDHSGLGISSTKWCTTQSNTCTPNSTMSGTTMTPLISVESSTNRICVQSTDNNNKTSEIACSDAYKLDKSTSSVSISVYDADVTIAASDSISNIKNVYYSLSGATTLSNTVYTSSFSITNVGTTIITAYYIDNAGNQTSDYTKNVIISTPACSAATCSSSYSATYNSGAYSCYTSCSSGWTASGSQCYKSADYTNPYCTKGTLSGSTCVRVPYTVESYSGAEYVCLNNGYVYLQEACSGFCNGTCEDGYPKTGTYLANDQCQNVPTSCVTGSSNNWICVNTWKATCTKTDSSYYVAGGYSCSTGSRTGTKCYVNRGTTTCYSPYYTCNGVNVGSQTTCTTNVDSCTNSTYSSSKNLCYKTN